MDSYPGSLSPLQREFLESWFQVSREYFLTGGALLAATTDLPRTTKDLDLFTVSPEVFQGVDQLVRHVASGLGAQVVALRDSPEFRRYRIERKDSQTLLDVVLDRAPQLCEHKRNERGIVMDSLEEVLVNKICAIVGRAEARDFVDTWFLCVRQGLDRGKALSQAQVKDGGVDAGALLYVLQDIDWEQFRVPGVDPVVVHETVDFFQAWARELALELYPKQD